MKNLTLERASLQDVICPLSGAVFRIQLWDTHQQDRYGKRRMAYAVFQQNPSFPSRYTFLAKGSKFYPSPLISCDGPDAARHLADYVASDLGFEDCCFDDQDQSSEVVEVSSSDEGAWL